MYSQKNRNVATSAGCNNVDNGNGIKICDLPIKLQKLPKFQLNGNTALLKSISSSNAIKLCESAKGSGLEPINDENNNKK